MSCSLQEEGIIVKAANSPWRCNDRGSAWLKIKPDYLQVSTVLVPVHEELRLKRNFSHYTS